jgi:hypothetical protein
VNCRYTDPPFPLCNDYIPVRAQGPQRVPEQTDLVVGEVMQQPGSRSIVSIHRLAVALLVFVTISERE